jgi:hypothetical protein
VEAHVGAAIVIVGKDDGDCPEGMVPVPVPTGEAIETNPVTCEAVVSLATVPDDVSNVVWLIANGDPSDPEVQEALAELSNGELVMVVTVLQNNQQHLGTDDGTVIDTIQQIASVAPAAAPVVALTSVVLGADPDAVIGAIIEGQAPEPIVEESIERIEEGAEIREDFSEEQEPPGGTDESAVDSESEIDDSGETGGEDDVEVVEVIETDTTGDGGSDVPPPRLDPPTVPPGGSIPEVSPTPTPVPPTPTPLPPTPTPLPPTPTPVPPTPTPVPPTPTPVPPTPTPIPPTPTPTPIPTPVPTPTPDPSPE